MRPQDTAYIIERLAVRFMAMVADHERQLAEHRASFGARTEADAKIIAGLREELDRVRNSLGIQAAKEANKVLGMVEGEGLRGAAERVVKERDGLLTQVQDMRAEMERLSAQLGWERAEIKRLQWENATMHKDAEDGYAEAIKVLGDPIALSKERDALRAEVAALQERLRDGQHGVWFAKNCEPCDPPEATHAEPDLTQLHAKGKEAWSDVPNATQWVEEMRGNTEATHDTPEGRSVAEAAVKREPKPGDVVRLVRVPTMEEYADWEDEFGVVGSLGIVKSLAHQVANVKYNDFTWEWPLSCVEVVTEATHDTEAGKAAAERTVRTEPVADEIKVWDVVEVYQATGKHTAQNDVGFIGTVGTIHLADRVAHVRSGLGMPHMVDLCDVRKVRKVTT